MQTGRILQINNLIITVKLLFMLSTVVSFAGISNTVLADDRIWEKNELNLKNEKGSRTNC